MAETLTAADKEAIKDELVRELNRKIESIGLQLARIGPTLTAANGQIYQDSMNKSMQELRDQMQYVQTAQFRSFDPQEPIADGALVKARFEPSGLPATETWTLLVPGLSQRRLVYKGREIDVGAGTFGYGGSLLGLRAGESSHVYGDGRSIPDYNVEVLEVL